MGSYVHRQGCKCLDRRSRPCTGIGLEPKLEPKHGPIGNDGRSDRINPARGLGANEQMIHTGCPSCGRPCTMWVWLEDVKHIAQDGTGVYRIKTTGTVTDLVHDELEAMNECGGI